MTNWAFGVQAAYEMIVHGAPDAYEMIEKQG